MMDQYVCPCGYEYDPAVGGPDNGVAPGTPWEDVPSDWVCPVCGLGKSEFEKAKDDGLGNPGPPSFSFLLIWRGGRPSSAAVYVPCPSSCRRKPVHPSRISA